MTQGNNGQPESNSIIPIQAKVLSQYVKDLSFENPNIRKLLTGPSEPPNIKVEVNVQSERVEANVYESAILFKATAANNLGTIYVIEADYAGLFRIESIPDQALEPFLLISGPMTLFPFLRRLIADVTREGGFPPLLLDPIDFAALYFQRKQEMAGSAGQKLDS
jgi:preprotein translocase subunit SecB